VDLSVTVCFCCVFVRLRISPPRINLAASNFARWFIGILGRQSPILGNFAPPEAPPEAQMGYMRMCNSYGGLIIRVARALADSSSELARRRIGMCGYTSVSEDGRTC